jgi:hypothetical protein
MIVDARPSLTAQPGQPLYQLSCLVHLEMIMMQMDPDAFAD